MAGRRGLLYVVDSQREVPRPTMRMSWVRKARDKALLEKNRYKNDLGLLAKNLRVPPFERTCLSGDSKKNFLFVIWSEVMKNSVNKI